MARIARFLKAWLLLFLLMLSIALIWFMLDFYRDSFAKNGLSKNIENWAHFATYMGLGISVVNALILGYISYAVYRLQSKRDVFEAIYLEAEQKPILIFAFDQQKAKWYVRNVGKGGAMNIVLANNGKNDEWEGARKCYSLAAGERYDIDSRWFPQPWRLLAIYFDIFQKNYYTSICYADETKTAMYPAEDVAAYHHWLILTRVESERSV